VSLELPIPTSEDHTPLSFAEFLEKVPPGTQRRVTNFMIGDGLPGKPLIWYLVPSEIQLHCPENKCKGTRFFRWDREGHELARSTAERPPIIHPTWTVHFMTFVCANCLTAQKTFALALKRDNVDEDAGHAVKFGELPVYGPPTPTRLLSMIGEENREVFLKGRRCENQGLGVGAFVYYRRVVERQKNSIIGEILRVAKATNASPKTVQGLESAMKEGQFSRAVELAKDGIPSTLMIKGHNPLILLHNALSEGLHTKSDEECLALANDIRVVLAELSERIGQALKDERELNDAVTRLMASKS
jgi:hypothetical protein